MATWRYKNPPAPARFSQFLRAASERWRGSTTAMAAAWRRRRTSSGSPPTSSRTSSSSSPPSATCPCTSGAPPSDQSISILTGPASCCTRRHTVLLCCFALLCCVRAGGVSRRWRLAVEQSLASRRRLSFAGQRTGDDTAARLVRAAVNIHDLDISRSCWGCQITDEGLIKISSADCVGNLTSISLWGLAGITDKGVVHLVSRAYSLKHLNIGGTFITDESLYAVANSCTNLKSIILWSCRYVTEAGLVALVNKCRRLECINVGGMRVPPESFVGLLSISPALQIRSIPQILNASVQVS